jgi:hypothetical protein
MVMGMMQNNRVHELVHELRRRRGGDTINAAAVAAARSRIAACYHILPHTQVQRLMAGSLEEVSEGYCLGEECSHVAEPEVADTRGIPHMLPGLRSAE